MLTKWKQAARRALTVAAIGATLTGAASAGGAMLADSAGASISNPGPGMGCTAGTDACAGWVASYHNPTCIAYNVYWSHQWYNVAGGWAYWHVQADQWWNGGPNCTSGGGAHLIGGVLDSYAPDYGTPHVSVGSGVGWLESWPHYYATLYGQYGSQGTTAWTPCVSPSADAYSIQTTNAHGQSANTFQAGTFSADRQGSVSATWCNTGNLATDSHNGSYVGWGDGVDTSPVGNNFVHSAFVLW